MKQHEREYFISRIRSGKYRIKISGITLEILTPTSHDEFLINEVASETYYEASQEGIKTEEEMHRWMVEKGLWTVEDDEKIEGLEKDIERLKVEIFNNRFNEDMVSKIRLYLRAGEKQLSEINNKKQKYYHNTCEGASSSAKVSEFVKRCTFKDGELYDFVDISPEVISRLYYSMFINDKTCRELARTEPWKSLWILNESNTFNLFANKDRELSHDQKNILIWSRMYDNVQESMDCPSDNVINDDDMLDGWFILQRRKREQEKNENELDKLPPNIANKQEVFLMAKNKKDAERINDMNSTHAKMIKLERNTKIKQQGGAKQLDFRDEKLRATEQSNNQFKGKFRR
jgi:hypothetical protein